jgi:hypothetical protein
VRFQFEKFAKYITDLTQVAQTYIFPVVVRCNDMKDAGLTLTERLEVFPWILSDLIFPFMMEYMMVSQANQANQPNGTDFMLTH